MYILIYRLLFELKISNSTLLNRLLVIDFYEIFGNLLTLFENKFKYYINISNIYNL